MDEIEELKMSAQEELTEEELKELWKDRMEMATTLENEVRSMNLSRESNILGKVRAELKSLQRTSRNLTRQSIDDGNLRHMRNVVDVAKREYDRVGVDGLLRSFVLVEPKERDLYKHSVDIVSDGGAVWAKVISRTAKGVAMDWLTSSPRTVVQQGTIYVEHANLFPHNFNPPKVVFHFTNGVPDLVAVKLERMGITVEGERIPLENLHKAPEELLEELMKDECEEGEEEGEEGEEESGEEEEDLPPITVSCTAPVNLDVSAVFVLISNLTHPGGCDHKFSSGLLRQQSVMEKKKKAREQLLSLIEGREWIVCETTLKSVTSIVSTVGGPTEKSRWAELETKLRVVPDSPSERSLEMEKTTRLNDRSIRVFGTGDELKYVTASANKHFVQSAFHQTIMDNKPEVLTTSVHCGQGAVRSIRYNVDGNYCITCGSDKSIKLWNPIRGIQIKTYTGTGNEVLDCASSSDNAQLVAGGLDRCLNIIDVETGKMLRRWRAHAAKVNAVAFNEESNVAFSASMDCTIQAFDARSRSEKPVQIFNEATDSVLSIEVHGSEIVAASADSHFRVYNLRNGSMTEDFMGDSVSCARFTPDGACVLVSTLRSPLRLIDKNDGKLLMSYKGHVSSDILLESVPLQSMDFVASGSEDGAVYVYGVLDGSIVARLDHGGEKKIVHSLACHPKKNHLLSTDGVSLFLWTPRGTFE